MAELVNSVIAGKSNPTEGGEVVPTAMSSINAFRSGNVWLTHERNEGM